MSEYRPRAYMNAVLKASSATHSARHVLHVMCWRAEFDRPEVTITKPQIAEETGLHVKTIREGIRALRTEGSIEVIHNRRGGRGNAPTYRLLVATKGEHNVRKGEHNVRKGEHNAPPTIDSIDSMTRRGAGRPANGINRKWKPSGQDGQPGSAGKSEKHGARGAPLTPAERVDAERFYKAMKIAGTYGEARALVAAWDAGEVEEPEG